MMHIQADGFKYPHHRVRSCSKSMKYAAVKLHQRPSKLADGKVRSLRSCCSNTQSGLRSRAVARSSRLLSMPKTDTPRAANAAETLPGPQPRSRIFWPGLIGHSDSARCQSRHLNWFRYSVVSDTLCLVSRRSGAGTSPWSGTYATSRRPVLKPSQPPRDVQLMAESARKPDKPDDPPYGGGEDEAFIHVRSL